MRFEQEEEAPRDVNTDVALCLYRVIHEALQNSIRHCKASDIQVILSCNGEQIQLVISGDHEGFDVENAMHNSGLGLVNKRESVRQNLEPLGDNPPRRRSHAIATLPFGSCRIVSFVAGRDIWWRLVDDAAELRRLYEQIPGADVAALGIGRQASLESFLGQQ